MLTTALLTAGSMADIFGRKRVLTIGLIIFTIASALCGLSTNITELILARGLQGIGGATMFACSLALIVQEFPANERAIAFGAYGAVNGISVALGPIVGGLLIEAFGWESIFFINVPIGIAVFFILRRKVVNLPGPETQIDWPGLATFSGFMFLTVFATIRGNPEGWASAEIIACYAGAIVCLALFIPIELRRRFPMFDLRLFKNRTFVGSSVSAFTVCFSCLALIFFLTTWFQTILGYSAIGTGTRMLVFSIAALAVGPIAGKATETISPRIVLGLSLGLVAVGVATMTQVDANDSWTAILPGLVLAGAGLGLAGPTLASTAVGVVPPWRGGMASGMNSTMREAGTTAGIAVLGAVLAHQIAGHVESSLSGSFLGAASKQIANAIAAGGTPELVAAQQADVRPGLREVAHVAYTNALQDVFLVGSIVAAVGCIAAVALVRRSDMREDAVGGH
jgi:EmrB/QacA subfamily drug resistance transporter